MNDSLLPLLTSAGGWVGFFFSLFIFSALFGDHALARLAQYLLVGLSLGYLGVVAFQYTLRPFLATLDDPGVAPANWLTVALAGVLLLAGLERILALGQAAHPPGLLRTLLHHLGAIPLGLLVGVALSTLLIGVIEGTLVPQTRWMIQFGLGWESWNDSSTNNLLTFLLTVSVLFFLTINPLRHLNDQPAPLRDLMRVVIWIGQRALWLAAGVLFARLFAARLSQLIGLIDFWLVRLEELGIGAWVRNLMGG